MNKHKKFIKDAYEGKYGTMCQDWKDTILEHYPEFKEEEFKVGDWVIGISMFPLKPRKITSFDGKVAKYNDPDIGKGENNGCHVKNLRKASPKEVEEHLIEEAKKRGFGNGYSAKCLVSNGCHYTVKDNDWDYRVRTDILFNGTCMVYREGKWAEIIKTMTKEEAEEKLGCKIV